MDAVTALREMADRIDRGPTFPVTPSVISALVRERADDLASQPRTWSLPAEPGPEVTAVRCTCHGIRWDRTDQITAARETLWQAEHHQPGFGWPTWRDLLANHDQLGDATGEAVSNGG